MILRVGQVYRCQNKDCGAEFQIVKRPAEAPANPRCCCGAEMKKPYSAPTLTEVKSTSELLRRFSGESQPLSKAAANDNNDR